MRTIEQPAGLAISARVRGFALVDLATIETLGDCANLLEDSLMTGQWLTVADIALIITNLRNVGISWTVADEEAANARHAIDHQNYDYE